MPDKLGWLRLTAPILGRYPALSYPLAAIVGAIGWQVRRDTRGMIVRNMLPFCGGNVAAAKREARLTYRNLARYWADLFSLPYRDLASLERDHLSIVHPEHLAPLAAPGPVMIVSAHMGNPELCLQALTARGRTFHALVENIKPKEFGDELLRLRRSGGGEFHPATLGGVKACLAALKEGGVVGLLADRDLQGTGICLPLAGRRVHLPRGPWEIARRADALVIPAFARRSWRDQFAVTIEEPFRVPKTADAEADIRCAATRFAGLLEGHIRRHPGQWTVFEDFWKVHGCG